MTPFPRAMTRDASASNELSSGVASGVEVVPRSLLEEGGIVSVASVMSLLSTLGASLLFLLLQIPGLIAKPPGRRPRRSSSRSYSTS
jgi:hypothetical protein